ncbi:MAG: hypothetical protein K0U86_19120 [Planctomycetes bacterium]|nr:hypothetical protein [Planctomycetota bacterium]MCH9727020.1 hypothetical protein [Planctomycetota bacterium]MCH9776148.1 hypothetical protein [Planctomycetota bacterium]MCH9789784.1 hypothetical protein [Planctomycetota bacterium]
MLRKCFCGMLLMVVVVQLNACGYPEVSPKTYEISKALYSVCNQKSEERLRAVKALIQSSLSNKEISVSEADMLNEIVAQAQADEWEEAMLESRNLMEDQAGR